MQSQTAGGSGKSTCIALIKDFFAKASIESKLKIAATTGEFD
jgi:hypothetical protein